MNNSPAARCAFIDMNKLTKLTEDDWQVSAYRSVDGGGTGEEYVENLLSDADSPGNKWYDCESGETWIQALFNTPTRIRHLQLKSANDCPERDPYQITITYPNLNGETKMIGFFDKIIWDQRHQIKDFNFDTGEEVQSLKITINKNLAYARDYNWASGTQLAQMILYR